MPIYEYQCNSCKKQISLLIRTITNPPMPVCSRCGSHEMTRLLSRFAVVKSEESRFEKMADPSNFGDLDENDRKVLRAGPSGWGRRWARMLARTLTK